MSSNRAGGIVSSTTTRRGETTQTLSATSEPVVPLSAASLSALGRTIDTTSSATPATSPSSTPATSTRAAVVRGTDACLNVREAPKTGARRLGCLAEGTAVKVVGGPSTGDGFTWYQIERAGSLEKGGWVVGQYLE